MINTSAWKEFKISDLFDVKNSKSISDKRGLDFDENNPYDFIGRTPVNNGIQGKIVKQDFESNNENTFSVTQIGEKLCLFRDNRWYACQNIFLLTPLYPELITAKFFICCVVTKTLKAVFGEDAYSSYPTKDTLSDMMVKLPATSDGQPDWKYMEDYMKAVVEDTFLVAQQLLFGRKEGCGAHLHPIEDGVPAPRFLMEESEKSLENLKKADDTKHLINVSGWGGFRVCDLFDVSRPSSRSSQNYDEGDMPFVASGNFNNGITAYLQPKDDNDYDEGGCITVSAVDGYAFYQKDKFLGRGGAGSSIMMLRNDNLNELNGKYICTLIRKACNNWEYSNMGNKDKLADTTIWLPTTSTGEPDWQYMEDYMRQIMDKSEQILSELEKVA